MTERLQIAALVVYADERHGFRGMVVGYGNLLQDSPAEDGKVRVYWGHNDQLTWENGDDLRKLDVSRKRLSERQRKGS